MTQKQMTPEIIEGNKLIAEFIGYKIDNLFPDKNKVYRLGSKIDLDTDFNYHSSWDWLMPVVEKIESGNYGFKMCRKVVEIYFDDTKEIILKVKKSSRLESLFEAIVQLITILNNQL